MPKKQLRKKKYQELTPKQKQYFKLINDMDDDWTDLMPGGLADRKKPSDFCPHQLAKGIDVELEHTDTLEQAAEIAMDHLEESKDFNRKGNPEDGGKYYDRLESIEKDIEEILSDKKTAQNRQRIDVDLGNDARQLAMEAQSLLDVNKKLKEKLKKVKPSSSKEYKILSKIKANNKLLFRYKDELERFKKLRQDNLYANTYCYFKMS